MKYFFLSLISLYLLNIFSCSLNYDEERLFPLLMPDVQPTEVRLKLDDKLTPKPNASEQLDQIRVRLALCIYYLIIG